MNSTFKQRIINSTFLKILAVIILLYFFLSAITMMSTAFKLMGKSVSGGLINVTASPIVALFVGILATALVQSSSVTTSMVVALVSAGTLSVENAVPIIMGANIGTTVTNTIVSVGHISNKQEFRRAFAGATMHDFFNIMSVAVLLPLELATGFLRKTATLMASVFYGAQSFSYHSPIKAATKVIPEYLKNFMLNDMHMHPKAAGIICLLLAFALIFICLFYLVKVMRSIMLHKIESILNKFLNKSALVTITIGILITAFVQSSSITTSLLVPMIGTGILSLRAAFPITLGANIGTTVTAILAALAGNVYGLTIAFVHLLFNIAGILIIYPCEKVRLIPIKAAVWLGERTAEDKKVLLYFIGGFFFILPLLFILGDKLF